MSTNQVIFQQININFSTFCRKFQYIDIIYSRNNATRQQVEVQKRFRIIVLQNLLIVNNQIRFLYKLRLITEKKKKRFFLQSLIINNNTVHIHVHLLS